MYISLKSYLLFLVFWCINKVNGQTWQYNSVAFLSGSGTTVLSPNETISSCCQGAWVSAANGCIALDFNVTTNSANANIFIGIIPADYSSYTSCRSSCGCGTYGYYSDGEIFCCMFGTGWSTSSSTSARVVYTGSSLTFYANGGTTQYSGCGINLGSNFYASISFYGGESPTFSATLTSYTCTPPPSTAPTSVPTNVPTIMPTRVPTYVPSIVPTSIPTKVPTNNPTFTPTNNPTIIPSNSPSLFPTNVPTSVPTKDPTGVPSIVPTSVPTIVPSNNPTFTPTNNPTIIPSNSPSLFPTNVPTSVPTKDPTDVPSYQPSNYPSVLPTFAPSAAAKSTSNAFGTNSGIYYLIIVIIIIIGLILIMLIIFVIRKKENTTGKSFN